MIGGIKDFDEILETEDPEHTHVKSALFIYSLNSFLFDRINKGSRQKNMSIVKNLGPYAVLLTRIIDNVGTRRTDQEKGKSFWCYRGLALPIETIESWKNQDII